jgi:hypothetical protein
MSALFISNERGIARPDPNPLDRQHLPSQGRLTRRLSLLRG